MKNFNFTKRFLFYATLGLVWLLLCFFSLINNPDTLAKAFLNESWKIIYLIIVNFVFFEYSLPFILKRKSNVFFNIIIGILLISSQLILVSFGLYAWTKFGIELHIYSVLREITLTPNGRFHELLFEVFYEAEAGIASVLFLGIAKLFHYNFNLRQTAQQLRLEKQEAELNYLKSQTNPHFLFNTLNNIYSLARDKSDLAPESILRLSKILRFMLYETSGAFISLEQEKEIISDYIALEKLRYDDSLRIDFTFEIEDMKQNFPPLLLIPLVENAFKHGASETSDTSFVTIHLSAKQQHFQFVVKNSIEKDGEESINENIGLSNLRKQLELLYTDYNLSIQKDETVFTATLKINLESHV